MGDRRDGADAHPESVGLGQQPAVDDERGSADERRLLGGEVDDCSGHLARVRDALAG